MSFKQITPWFKEVFALVDTACKELNIPVYLIGAQARDIHLAEQGIQPYRGTMDIDFAIMLPDIGVYETLVDNLIKRGFRKVKEPYRLIFDRTNTVIDLLPFGEIEEKGTVKFTDRVTELSVVGLKEVLAMPEIKKVDNETNILVPPLGGIIILKLVSYDEKPERTKDLDDINDILNNYFELYRERLFDEYADRIAEFSDDHFMLESGAWLAGVDIGRILNRNQELKKLITGILESEIDKPTGGITSYFYGKKYVGDIDQIKSIFKLILKGINE